MKITLMGCKGTTLDLLNSIVLEKAFNINQVITLPENLGKKHGIAFFQGNQIKNYCKTQSIPVHTVNSYNLKDPSDLKFFQEAQIALLLVIGWERIVPDNILKTLGKFACGMHGSPYGLPKGRGRSPMNWSLITGHNRFVTNLFKYNPFIDAGEIIGFQVFEINEFDSIASLHSKNRIAMYQLLKTYIPLIEKDQVIFKPQSPIKPTFYPKRVPDDSAIDWNLNTLQIYNLIRAVSPPYPPAFCFYKGKKIFILEAYPFDTALFTSEIKPGTIVDISITLNEIVIKTKDGSLLVKKFTGLTSTDLQIGEIFQGADSDAILQDIVKRYSEKTPLDQREI